MSLLYFILVLFAMLSLANIRPSFKLFGISPSFLIDLITLSKGIVFVFALG